MKRQSLDEMESRMGPADVVRPLTDALGAADMALNYYELAPGDSFAYGYHAHDAQEEVFYVQEGAVTFTTAEGDVEVGAGELVRFGPGEYQRGVNRGDERVVALAPGVPPTRAPARSAWTVPTAAGVPRPASNATTTASSPAVRSTGRSRAGSTDPDDPSGPWFRRHPEPYVNRE